MNKSAVANATTDVLGSKLLQSPVTWQAVERAVPPIRHSGRGGDWGTRMLGDIVEHGRVII